MKRNTVLKTISACIICAFLCNMIVLAVEPSSMGGIGKISESVSAKLAETPSNEKISVYVYFTDESDEVLTTMKSQYADLYATYATAKGSEIMAAENSIETLSNAERTANIDAARLQTAIETKRQLYSTHYSAKNTAVLKKHGADEDVLFISSYAPMAIVSVTARELKALALDASVARIDLLENREMVLPIEVNTNRDSPEEPEYIEEHWNKNSRADYVRDTLGLTGVGVKIGQVELGLPYVYDQFLANATIITNSAYGGEEWESIENENHATNVARIMVGTHGVAPDAILYAACAGSTAQFYGAIEWLVSQGVNVINMSASTYSTGEYDSFCRFIDHLAVQHDVHFVVSSGNVGILTPDPLLGSPALAYNAITVGAYNDNNTVPANNTEILAKQSDDFLEDYSKYVETYTISTDYDGAYKPNLVATGNYFWYDSDANGTSYAAPQVTGAIAQLCSYDSALKTKQSSMGAILMAGCGRKILNEVTPGSLIETQTEYKGGDYNSDFSEDNSDNQISDRQGAGKLDAYWAYTVARDDNYWSLTLDSSVTSYTKDVYITKSTNSLTRISAFWLKKNYIDGSHTASGNSVPSIREETLPNWNLRVIDPNGQEIAVSATTYNNYEIVQFVPPVSGRYRITIERSASSDNALSYVGLAVW